MILESLEICLFNGLNQDKKTVRSLLTSDLSKSICKIPTPALSSIEIPIQITLKVQNDGDSIYACQPFKVYYKIENMIEKIQDIQIEIIDSSDFIVSGGVRTIVAVAPFEEEIITFTLVPLNSGKLSLPSIDIKDLDSEKLIIRDFKEKILVIPF
jgi:hypothetical protein